MPATTKRVNPIQSFLGRVFTPDLDEQFNRQLRREALYFADVIQQRLTQMEFCYRYSKNQSDWSQQGVQEIQFVKGICTPEAIYLMIDSQRLPRGKNLMELDREDVKKDLTVSCRRPVEFRHKTKSGAWFIIAREGAVGGIPRRLAYEAVLEGWPESSNKKLLVPLGMSENRNMIYRSLARFPHALIGGSTGAGKTTFLHAWICALILKNDAEDLRLGLIDLKGGTEFTRYKKLPHLMDNEFIGADLEGGGFIKRPDDVTPLLSFLQQEVDRRLARFERAGGIQNINVWNYRRRNSKLPRIVLFVDELAVIMLDPQLKKNAHRLLADITARGRAPGIHVVLATQRPEVKVVPGLIKGNLDARFAFRVTDNPSSMVILDSTEAARFDDSTPLGRYIYRSGLDRAEIQAPLITDEQIARYVKNVIEGRGIEEALEARMSPEAVFRFAVEQLEGNFSYRRLYQALEGEVSTDYLRRLGDDYEGKIVEINGELYELIPGNGGNQPRRFVPVSD